MPGFFSGMNDQLIASFRSARRRRPPNLAFDLLHRRCGGLRHTVGAWQRRRRHMIEPDHADDLFDQVGTAFDVTPPAGGRNLPV